MHVDFTFHFWSALSQLTALGAGIKFLLYLAHQVKELVDAIKDMVHEHNEMYGWYQRTKDQVLDH